MMFNKHKATLLDEKWNVVKTGVKFKVIPRIHELIYLTDEGKYYRVVNIVHNVNKGVEVFIIIELYTDDFKLMEKE